MRISALGYTSSYTVTTVFEGIKYTYLLVDDGNISLNLINSCPAQVIEGVQEKGTRIEFPIDNDYYEWERKLKSNLVYFDRVVLNLNGKVERIEVKKFGDYIMTNGGGVSVSLGRVPYPINWRELGREKIDIDLALEVPLDCGVDIIPSREHLIYDSVSKAYLNEKLDELLEYVKTFAPDMSALNIVEQAELCKENYHDIQGVKIHKNYLGIKFKVGKFQDYQVRDVDNFLDFKRRGRQVNDFYIFDVPTPRGFWNFSKSRWRKIGSVTLRPNKNDCAEFEEISQIYLKRVPLLSSLLPEFEEWKESNKKVKVEGETFKYQRSVKTGYGVTTDRIVLNTDDYSYIFFDVPMGLVQTVLKCYPKSICLLPTTKQKREFEEGNYAIIDMNNIKNKNSLKKLYAQLRLRKMGYQELKSGQIQVIKSLSESFFEDYLRVEEYFQDESISDKYVDDILDLCKAQGVTHEMDAVFDRLKKNIPAIYPVFHIIGYNNQSYTAEICKRYYMLYRKANLIKEYEKIETEEVELENEFITTADAEINIENEKFCIAE